MAISFSKPTTAYKEGRVFKHMDIEFFACCGHVRLIDNREQKGKGKFRDYDPAEFYGRAERLWEEIQKKGHLMSYEDKARIMRMINFVEEACKEAVEMGSPFDPKVQAYHRRHKTHRRAMVLAGAPQRMHVTEEGLLVPELALS